MKRKVCALVLAAVFGAGACSLSWAKGVTLLYTGGTHGMIYPCNCPFEPDGGLARRATLIRELRKQGPGALVLDSGAFFSGGLMDEYTQSSELDMKRTALAVEGMGLMGYDAAGISADELNYGKVFLEENSARARFPFVACNLKSAAIRPYIIKEAAGVKFGITSVISASAAAKADGLEIAEPREALKEAVARMKKEGAAFIILLSQLEEKQNLNLIRAVGGIDILIDNFSNKKEEAVSKNGSVLIVKASWEGRKLGKLTFDIEGRNILNYKAELLRLSDEVNDDAAIKAILPECFSDLNCRQGALRGSCKNSGGKDAKCLFVKPAKVRLTVISAKECVVCDTKRVVEYLKQEFPGLDVSYFDYTQRQAKQLIAKYGIQGLPVYLLGKEAEKEAGFAALEDKLAAKDDCYILEPGFSGMAYFLNRPRKDGSIDVFLSLYDPNAVGILENIRPYRPVLHFLASPQGDDFTALKGKPEVEEYLRGVCVEKYYPDRYWDYLTCRARDITSSWWQECLPGVDVSRIESCAKCREGKDLLKQNTSLNRELEIMFGPLYLVDNHEIFGTRGVPNQEEFRKLFKMREVKK